MQIDIRGKNIEITDKLKSYSEKKLGRLERYLPYITDVHLELAQEHHRHEGERSIAQLTIRDKRGTILRAEDKSQTDMQAAVDVVVDKIHRQISRYKDKRRRRTGDRFEVLEPEFAAAESVPSQAEPEDQPEPAEVVRRKRIDLTPMSEEEAIDQLELLGHDFFVFYNANTGGVNVLYHRKGGGYGVLEPIVV